jgi:hypothetical protein
MFRCERLLVDRERALVERLRVGIAAQRGQRRIGDAEGPADRSSPDCNEPATSPPRGSGLVRWTKFNRPLIESTCAENNENYGTFLGLREYQMPEAKIPDF